MLLLSPFLATIKHLHPRPRKLLTYAILAFLLSFTLSLGLLQPHLYTCIAFLSGHGKSPNNSSTSLTSRLVLHLWDVIPRLFGHTWITNSSGGMMNHPVAQSVPSTTGSTKGGPINQRKKPQQRTTPRSNDHHPYLYHPIRKPQKLHVFGPET